MQYLKGDLLSRDIDLVLVNPGLRKQVYGKLASTLKAIEPPIWCALIAAYVRKKGYKVKIIDAEAENWSPEFTADKIIEYNPVITGVIAIGSNPSASSTPKMTSAGEILKEIKKKSPDLKTIIGGLHPSALPERTLREENVNFVCQGEGFFTFSDLLQKLKSKVKMDTYKIKGLWYIKNNEIISNPRAPLIKDLDELPFAAWDLLPMDKYRAHNWHCFSNIDKRKPYAVIYTSLGCPFNCTYCNIHALYDNKPGIRFRSPKKVVEEIGYLVDNYNIKNIKILDELFVLKKDRVDKICDLIIKAGFDLNIWAYARVDTIKKEVLSKMKKAGFNWLAIGFESANKQVRKGVDKKFDEKAIKKAIKITKEAGINIIGNFIFGLPDDDLNTMEETLEMAKKFNFEYVNFYTAMAYPGSQLYLEALKKGIKLPKTWSGYSQYSKDTLPLSTKYLSPEEVLEFRDKAFEEYFNNPSYLEMIENKFGNRIIEHIKEMLGHKISRKIS